MVVRVEFDGRTLSVPVRWVRGRSISVVMTASGPELRTPRRVSTSRLEDIVRATAPKLITQIESWSAVSTDFYWRGELHGLILRPDLSTPRWHEAHLLSPNVEAALRFLRRSASERLISLTWHWADIMGEAHPWVGTGDFRSRWGSCTSRTRRIRLNWRLGMTPDAVADAIIIHELAHLKHANHSARFWEHVRSFDPDPEKSNRWLREFGPAVMGWPRPAASAFLA
ncbi:MAG: DUF45 domain-containing protein [Fimbriimonadaceae bacterium]|nr:DUF45 domain-containing protein [Fimbriimonadaceae bacterium]